jgi:hypothetical protein
MGDQIALLKDEGAIQDVRGGGSDGRCGLLAVLDNVFTFSELTRGEE